MKLLRANYQICPELALDINYKINKEQTLDFTIGKNQYYIDYYYYQDFYNLVELSFLRTYSVLKFSLNI